MLWNKRYTRMLYLQTFLCLAMMAWGVFTAISGDKQAGLLMVVWGFFMSSDLRRELKEYDSKEILDNTRYARSVALKADHKVHAMEAEMFDKLDGIARFYFDQWQNDKPIKKVAEEAPVGWESPTFAELPEDAPSFRKRGEDE